MAETFDTWESYFYPETYQPATRMGTLENRFGQRDPDVLGQLEYAATGARAQELRAGKVDIPRTFDASHLDAIHKYLFEPVYEWAGHHRSFSLWKDGQRFAEPEGGEIDAWLARAHHLVTTTPWGELDPDEFAAQAAEVYAYVNHAHPYREGNGRTSKLFMKHVA